MNLHSSKKHQRSISGVRMLTKGTIIFFAMLTVVVLCRGPLYRSLVKYQPVGQRAKYEATNKNLTGYIDSETATFAPKDVRDIIEVSLALTTQSLAYGVTGTRNNPNTLLETKKANCVGYAAFFVTTFNYLCRKHGLGNRWTARHVVGKIEFMEMNVHGLFSSPYFRDHDYAIVENKLTGERIFTDPTVADYLLIDRVASR